MLSANKRKYFLCAPSAHCTKAGGSTALDPPYESQRFSVILAHCGTLQERAFSPMWPTCGLSVHSR